MDKILKNTGRVCFVLLLFLFIMISVIRGMNPAEQVDVVSSFIEFESLSRPGAVSSFFLVIYYAIVSILFIDGAFLLYRTGYRKYAKQISLLGLLCVSIGLWVISDSFLGQILFRIPSIRYTVLQLSLLTIPIGGSRYFMEQTNLPFMKRLMRVTIIAYELLISFALFVDLLKSGTTDGILHCVFTCMIVLFMEVIVVCIIKMVKTCKFENPGYLISAIIMIITCVIAFTDVKNEEAISIYIGYGFMLMTLVILATQIPMIINHYIKAQKLRNYAEIAEVDPITQGNSKLVADRWIQEADYHFYETVWLLQMNILKFNTMNILCGRKYGDEVLADIYHKNQNILPRDGIQFMIGGSDFYFILTDVSEIKAVCHKLSDGFHEYMEQKNEQIPLSVDFAAIRIHKGDSLDQLLDGIRLARANANLSFDDSCACYFYTSACRDEDRRRVQLETGMREGIREKEFKMYLQPKISPADGVLMGAEALVRWDSSELGFISPDQFTSILESSGKIKDLDLYMFRLVCEYLVFRKAKCLEPIRISVNVSKNDLNQGDFFAKYREIIQELDVPTEYLEFEITESMAYDDVEKVRQLIEEMHEVGAKVAMDDFGSAYSNLGLFGTLGFDVVKFDKSFFSRNFPNDGKEYVLIKGLIGVFHDLGIEVVCEGIETEEQKNALVDLHADLIQGYYYSKPLAENEFTIWADTYFRKRYISA